MIKELTILGNIIQIIIYKGVCEGYKTLDLNYYDIIFMKKLTKKRKYKIIRYTIYNVIVSIMIFNKKSIIKNKFMLIIFYI